MAEWVLKGSLKGPQGDPGADAQLPEGGGTGDFLQKKADGTGWFDSEGLLRASYIGTLQQLGDEGQSLEIHDVSVTSNGYVAGVSTGNPPEDGAFVYANDKNSAHTGHNRVGVLNGIPYVDLGTTDAAGENGHLAADGRYSYVDDIEAADAAGEQGEALTIPTGAAVKQYVTAHAGDALPEGGTDGQVLTKTADGEAWEDVPETDLTGYLSIDENNILQTTDGGTKSPTYIKVKTSDIVDAYSSITSGFVTASTTGGKAEIKSVCGDAYASLVAEYDWPARIETNGELKIGSKSVSSITDTITPSDSELPTGKAVADYVAANAGSGLPEGGTTGQVLTKSASGAVWADAVESRLGPLWEGSSELGIDCYIDDVVLFDAIGISFLLRLSETDSAIVANQQFTFIPTRLITAIESTDSAIGLGITSYQESGIKIVNDGMVLTVVPGDGVTVTGIYGIGYSSGGGGQ